MSDALTEIQLEVTSAVLDEEETRRRHLVVHLSGAHAYGFASPNSDVDLKAIHIAPTRRLLGLGKPQAAADRLEVIREVEVDYSSNELLTAVRGLLRGDGNMLERILSAEPLRSDPCLVELADLARQSLSRKFYNHYRGFALSQRMALEAAEEPTAKKALYVLRTALTGTHLLEAGECVPDLTALAPGYGFEEAEELIEVKRASEKEPLSGQLLSSLPGLLDRAFERLDEARDRSDLPLEAPHRDELERWLLSVRIEDLERSA